ncbi:MULTISPECIES: hypothetical protein [unclassified Nonomuraea]|uniref:hypothetical protein n=1 Tax=unclassified Nonomuraea TaxID=2593643 RepID=UPI0033EC8416
MTVSTVPAALEALVAAGTRALPGVRVWDGYPLASDTTMLCVGFTGQQDEAAVESTRTRQQAALEPEHEAYAVSCYLYVLKGDTDARQTRQALYELLDALAGELVADPTLSGAVARAQMSTESLTQTQTDKGAQAELRFVILIDAWTD